jgi:hypothetical protein
MEKLIVVSISLSAKLGIYWKVHLLGESKDRRNFVSLLQGEEGLDLGSQLLCAISPSDGQKKWWNVLVSYSQGCLEKWKLSVHRNISIMPQGRK